MNNKSKIVQIINNYNPPKKSINVFMIGLRGYTQNYGGWEAFAHGLFDNWTDKDVQWWAFEKVDSIDKEEIVVVNNIICVRVYEGETGSSAMPKYDIHCTDLTCHIVKSLKVSNPVMFHLGVRIGPVLWLKRHSIKKHGIIMMENPAGAEWRRTKWNRLVQIYLFISAMMMAKSTDCMVCDNEGIRELYNKLLIGRKPLLEYVAYGVNSVPRVSEKMPESVAQYFNKWGIERDNYYLILGRFIPENNYEMMFKGFMKSKTNKKLFVICNYKSEIKSFYNHIKKATGFKNDDRIIMAGTLYDQEILHFVRQYAHGYIHGHSVGGTNPGLLEAMAETDLNLLYNVNFNRYVGGKAALYFKDENELALKIEKLDSISESNKKAIGIKARNNMKNKYSWKHIVDEYDKVICGLLYLK